MSEIDQTDTPADAQPAAEAEPAAPTVEERLAALEARVVDLVCGLR